MNTLDFNGIVLNITTPGSRTKFDCTTLKAFVFRRWKTRQYNGQGESLFPIAGKTYPNETEFKADIRALCKKARVPCPADFID